MQMKESENGLRLFHFPLFNKQENLVHFSTTRYGGIGKGSYASLNLGEYCGDEPEAVQWNRKQLCQALSIPDVGLYVANQVHGSEIAFLDEMFFSLPEENRIKSLYGVDALITRMPGVCVAVATADCVPVILYAPDKKVVAAVHAGWRGTVSQIAGKVALRLINEFQCCPAEILAGIGPSICKERFEVGEEVADSFRTAGFDMNRILSRNAETNKPHIDLWEANRLQLLNAGVLPGNIEIAGLCTYTRSEDFFSARRQGINCGRMLTGISLRK